MSLPRFRRASAVAIFTTVAFVAAQLPTRALAQGVNVTQAESLFNQGKDLVEAQDKLPADKRNYKPACDKFAASLKLDETVNTHVALARCLDLDGRTASAWGEYLTGAKKGAGTPAGQYASEQAKLIEKRLLKVNLKMALVPDDLVIKIDNEAIPKESVNADLPLDPGDHNIEATAANKHKFEKHFRLQTDNSPLSVPVSLEDMTPEEIKAQQAAQNGGGGGGGPTTETVEDPGSPAKRWIGVGMMAVGLGGIVYGIVALVNATDNQSKFTQEGAGLKTCALNDQGQPSDPKTQPVPCHVTDTSGLTFADRANRFYIQMGVAGGAGILLAGIGAYLTLTSFGSKKVVEKSSTSATVYPILGPSVAGVGLTGHF